MRTLRVGLAAALVPVLLSGQAGPADLDQFVQRAMKTFEVPGLSLAIVKDGRLVVAKGYGVRKLGESAPVDAKTRFGIASNTKAFTATALGILVEEGKVEWDAPVISYLPGFALYDPFVTRELTVRDLLVHRSGLGLGAGDLLWLPPSTYDRKEIARRLRFIKPATSFRSAYAYDNVLYLVAGELIEAVTGQSWEDFIASRILAKVGMTRSTPGPIDESSGNVAATHARVEGRVTRISPFMDATTNAAGGIHAGAEDLAKWLIVQLDSGRLSDGSRLYSPATARELWSIVTPMPIDDLPEEVATLKASFNGYALGFVISDYRGRKMVAHTGGDPGHFTRVAMIPDLRLGVVVLTNQESRDARDAISYHILDAYLGASPVDYISIFKELDARRRAAIVNQMTGSAAARDSLSRPSLPLANYAGTYTDSWYGDITITTENGKLVMRFSHTPQLTGDLVHWQHDTFVARWRDRALRADAFVTFALTPDGGIDEVKMRAVSPETDFSFDFQDLLLKPARSPR